MEISNLVMFVFKFQNPKDSGAQFQFLGLTQNFTHFVSSSALSDAVRDGLSIKWCIACPNFWLIFMSAESGSVCLKIMSG